MSAVLWLSACSSDPAAEDSTPSAGTGAGTGTSSGASGTSAQGAAGKQAGAGSAAVAGSSGRTASGGTGGAGGAGQAGSAGSSATGGTSAGGSGGAPAAGSGGSPAAGSGGASGGAGGAGSESATFAAVYQEIKAGCGCHVTGMPGGLSMSTQMAAYNNLVGVTSTKCSAEKRVVKGDADKSVLFHSVAHTSFGSCEPDPMPRGMNAVQWSTAQQELVRSWIEAGANND